MPERYEIRLSGSGGQGLVTAGIILAEAVGVYEGKSVCQSQSYGPEARGGASKSEVIVSDEEIDYPKAIKPDVLLAMNQSACDTYLFDVKPRGTIIVDTTLVKQLPTTRVIGIPFTRIAKTEAGSETAANIVALGAVAAITKICSTKHLEAAVLCRVPRGTEETNKKALAAGFKAARKWLKLDSSRTAPRGRVAALRTSSKSMERP
jgi:2-oxoglutarate ferredoxin oxidoreductase subunit gamma